MWETILPPCRLSQAWLIYKYTGDGMRNLKVWFHKLVAKMAFGRLSNKGCWYINNPVQKNDSGFLLDFEILRRWWVGLRMKGPVFFFSLKGFCGLPAPKFK